MYVQNPAASEPPSPERPDTVLRVQYQAEEAGMRSAMSFKAAVPPDISPAPPMETDLWFQYDVMFGSNFEFVHDGKLPGLGGSSSRGQAPTGCDTTTPAGFSARLAWHVDPRRPGTFVLDAYLDFPGKGPNNPCGLYYLACDDLQGNLSPPPGAINDVCQVPVEIVRGQWYTLTQHVVLNNPSQSNGRFELFVNRQAAPRLLLPILNWRESAVIGISTVCMDTFFGGAEVVPGNPPRAPKTGQFAYFNNFVVSTERPF